MDHREDEEDEIFRRKVHTLRDVAIDLSEVLKGQSKQITGLEPLVTGTYSRVRASIMRLGSMDAKQFRAGLFYFMASVFFLFVLFIYMFVV